MRAGDVASLIRSVSNARRAWRGKLRAVELDDEAALRPADVDQQAARRSCSAAAAGAGALDEGVRKSRSSSERWSASVAVVGEDRRGAWLTPLRLGPPRHRALDRPQVERLAPLGLLDGAGGAGLRGATAGEVEERPRDGGDRDAVDDGDVFGVEGAASGSRIAGAVAGLAARDGDVDLRADRSGGARGARRRCGG